MSLQGGPLTSKVSTAPPLHSLLLLASGNVGSQFPVPAIMAAVCSHASPP